MNRRIAAVLAALLPLASGRPALADLDRSTPVPPGAARPFRAPAVQESTLADGMRLALAEIQRLPVVAVQLVLPFAGSAYDPADKAGLAAFVGGLMMEGASGKDSRRFGEAVDALGAQLDVAATPDGLVATLFTVKENLDKAMGLLASMVRSPALPASELPRLRQTTLTGLAAEQGDPGHAADRQFGREVFGSHPYGRQPDARSVSAIELADIQAFASTHVRPDGAILAASGDVDMARFSALAAKHFGGWAASGAAPAAVPAIPETGGAPAKGMTISLIDIPGSEQSAIRAGHLSVTRTAPDYVAVKVMTFILGGGFSSRLNQNLREQHGWTYGASASVTPQREGGAFEINVNVQTDATVPALQETLKEISRMQNELVPAEELAEAKAEIAGSFVLGQQKVQAVAGQIASNEINGLPADYVARFRQQVLDTTAEQVQAAAKAHLRAGDLRIVIAGDAAKIQPGLGQIAPVHVVPAAGGPAS